MSLVPTHSTTWASGSKQWLQWRFAWLNLILTAPLIYLYLGLPLMLRAQGWSGLAIGLFQLTSLPAVLKWLLALPIERSQQPPQQRYQHWAKGLMAAYAIVLLLIAGYTAVGEPGPMLFIGALLASLLGTWADIPINALAIQCLPAQAQTQAGAWRSAATSIGAIVGGGLMLMLHTHWGWAAPLLTLSSGLLISLAVIPRACTQQNRQQNNSITPVSQDGRSLSHIRTLWKSYFQSNQYRRWLWVLMGYFPCIGTAWFYLKPLLVDHGIPLPEIALKVGFIGGALAALAALISGAMTHRWSAKITLPLFAGHAWVALGLLWLAHHQGDTSLLWWAAYDIALAMGSTAGLLFALMMQHTRPGLTALDYGLQASSFTLSRLLVPLGAGWVMDQAGMSTMLLALFILSTVFWIPVYGWRQHWGTSTA